MEKSTTFQDAKTFLDEQIAFRRETRHLFRPEDRKSHNRIRARLRLSRWWLDHPDYDLRKLRTLPYTMPVSSGPMEDRQKLFEM